MGTLLPEEFIQKFNSLTDYEKREVGVFLDTLGSVRKSNIKSIKTKHARMHGEKTKNSTHRALGKLIFEDDIEDAPKKPCHNFYIELYDDDIIKDDYLGRGWTDMEGKFEIWYDPADAGKFDIPDLELRIYEIIHHYDKNGNVHEKPHLIHKTKPRNNNKEQTCDFEILEIPYWDYDNNRSMPRTFFYKHGSSSEDYTLGRTIEMVKSVLKLQRLKIKHELINNLNKNLPEIDSIQNDYPENLTVKLEKENPGSTRSDEYFGERMLNGMQASVMDKYPKDPSKYWIYHHWNSYQQDGEHCLPNVEMIFELQGEKLFPTEINLSLRENGMATANSPTQKHTFYPEDGTKWEAAKRMARVSAALSAQLDTHLVMTHLNIEQYSLALHRNVRLNPIRRILYPHVKEVSLINQTADQVLLNKNGHLCTATGLTHDSVVRRCLEGLGGAGLEKLDTSKGDFLRASICFSSKSHMGNAWRICK